MFCSIPTWSNLKWPNLSFSSREAFMESIHKAIVGQHGGTSQRNKIYYWLYQKPLNYIILEFLLIAWSFLKRTNWRKGTHTYTSFPERQGIKTWLAFAFKSKNFPYKSLLINLPAQKINTNFDIRSPTNTSIEHNPFKTSHLIWSHCPRPHLSNIIPDECCPTLIKLF